MACHDDHISHINKINSLLQKIMHYHEPKCLFSFQWSSRWHRLSWNFFIALKWILCVSVRPDFFWQKKITFTLKTGFGNCSFCSILIMSSLLGGKIEQPRKFHLGQGYSLRANVFCCCCLELSTLPTGRVCVRECTRCCPLHGFGSIFIVYYWIQFSILSF